MSCICLCSSYSVDAQDKNTERLRVDDKIINIDIAESLSNHNIDLIVEFRDGKVRLMSALLPHPERLLKGGRTVVNLSINMDSLIKMFMCLLGQECGHIRHQLDDLYGFYTR